MSDSQLCMKLVTHRFWRMAQADGMDSSTALAMAKELANTNRDEIESCGVPEMTIVSIFDTYYKSLSLSVKSRGPNVDISQLDIKQFQHNVTGHIEKQRDRFVKGYNWFFPRSLDEYTQYRVVLECSALSKMESTSLGLGRAVVTEMMAWLKPIMTKRYA